MNQRDKDELRGILENWPATPEASGVMTARAVQIAVAEGITSDEFMSAVRALWDTHSSLARIEAKISALEGHHKGD